MKELFTAFALLLGVTSFAQAKDVTITLNDAEQQAILRLIDAGVKAMGLQGVPAAVSVLGKLQAANKDALAPTAPAPVPAKPEEPKPAEKK